MNKTEEIKLLKSQLKEAITIAMEALHPSCIHNPSIYQKTILLMRLYVLKKQREEARTNKKPKKCKLKK
jgi:hypothetical protein